jgi:hypothetical protein
MNDMTQTTAHQVSTAYAAIAGWYSGAAFTCNLHAKRLRDLIAETNMDKHDKAALLSRIDALQETIAASQRHEDDQRAAAGLDPLNR